MPSVSPGKAYTHLLRHPVVTGIPRLAPDYMSWNLEGRVKRKLDDEAKLLVDLEEMLALDQGAVLAEVFRLSLENAMGREHHDGIIHVVTDALPPVQFHMAPPTFLAAGSLGFPTRNRSVTIFSVPPWSLAYFHHGLIHANCPVQAFIMPLASPQTTRASLW